MTVTTGALVIMLVSFFASGLAGGVGFSILTSLIMEGGIPVLDASVGGMSSIGSGVVSFLLNSSMTI